MSFKRPADINVKAFYTYIANDDGQTLRLRIEIASHQGSSIKTLLSGIVKRTDLNLAKKIHRFLHTSPEKTIGLLKDAGMSSAAVKETCRKAHAACSICVSSGRPKDKIKLSLTHGNEAFNVEIQTHFATAYIRNDKYGILNIIDMGTGYCERTIATSRSSENIQKLLEATWINHHGHL